MRVPARSGLSHARRESLDMTPDRTPTRQRPADLGRRDLLGRGALGLVGFNVARLAAAPLASHPTPSGGLPPIKACILIYYFGGPSHLDMWDMKPDAPSEVRGEFQSIATNVPGLRVCEHLPRLARIADKLTLVRSMHHRMRDHNAAAVEALCGRAPIQGDVTFLVDDANSFPSFGTVLSYIKRDQRGLLPHVALPHVMYRTVKLPGQTAGFLGNAYSGFQVDHDPSATDFRVRELDLPNGLSHDRIDDRRSLQRQFNAHHPFLAVLNDAKAARATYHRAADLLRSEPLRTGFDIAQESPLTRERYGRNKHGQSVLVARRLVESGVRFVNVNHRQFNGGSGSNWDTHYSNFSPLKNSLLPPADRALTALIEDLQVRGLLASTLVIAMGEFGRTPRINKYGARDHWPDCYTVVLAGGGARGGLVYGSSDRLGAYPASNPVTPGDLAATLYWRFGIDHTTVIHDHQQRPYRLADGEPLRELFSPTL